MTLYLVTSFTATDVLYPDKVDRIINCYIFCRRFHITENLLGKVNSLFEFIYFKERVANSCFRHCVVTQIERTNCFLDSFLQNFLTLRTIDGANVRKKDNTINSEYYLVIVYRFLLCRSSSLADSMVDLDSRSSWMLVIDFVLTP